MPGKLTIYIGPNGYGKTTKLETEKARIEKTELNNTIFLPSEILLEDELKDLENSKSMECFLEEIFLTPENINALKTQIQREVNTNILNIKNEINRIIDNVLILNDSTREENKDFISPSTKGIEYKKVLSIDKTIFKQMGSGQKMLLLLEFILRSNKNYIFLDEPEKYMQPSLIKILGEKIRNLITQNKNVYISTHSPKLLSFLEFNLDSINLLNEKNGNCKKIDLNKILNTINEKINIRQNVPEKFKKYFEFENLQKSILQMHRYNFFDTLFSKKVILCEGINDKFFIEKLLRDNNKQFEDYVIFPTFGKPNIPIFLEIFNSLHINTQFYFDMDPNSKDAQKNEWNMKINNYFHEKYFNKYYGFTPNIEEELNFPIKRKSNTLEFINHLEKISFRKSKYLIPDSEKTISNKDNNETN